MCMFHNGIIGGELHLEKILVINKLVKKYKKV